MTRGGSKQWLANQCVFLHRSEEATRCDYCSGQFGFWNGHRRHCKFCGSLVHSRCSLDIRPTPDASKVKICQRCYTYRTNYSQMLREGEEFIAYTGRLPAAAFLRLSEEDSCLLLTIDPAGIEETISLADIVSIQRGFSHAGHMRAASLYDPLRCFSIATKDTTFDLKADSLTHCELWITSLKTALDVFHRHRAQEEAVSQHIALGHALPTKGYLYFPEKKESPVIIHIRQHKESDDEKSTKDLPVISEPEIEMLEEEDMVVVEVTSRDSASREATPTSEGSPMVARKAHYKIRTLPSPYKHLAAAAPSRSDHFTATLSSQRSPPNWRAPMRKSVTSHGLPYKGRKSPLASNCPCHAYAIEQSRMFLFPVHSPENSDPFATCCEQCRGKCRVVHDLSTF